jgi:hypothetical protein
VTLDAGLSLDGRALGTNDWRGGVHLESSSNDVVMAAALGHDARIHANTIDARATDVASATGSSVVLKPSWNMDVSVATSGRGLIAPGQQSSIASSGISSADSISGLSVIGTEGVQVSGDSSTVLLSSSTAIQADNTLVLTAPSISLTPAWNTNVQTDQWSRGFHIGALLFTSHTLQDSNLQSSTISPNTKPVSVGMHPLGLSADQNIILSTPLKNNVSVAASRYIVDADTAQIHASSIVLKTQMRGEDATFKLAGGAVKVDAALDVTEAISSEQRSVQLRSENRVTIATEHTMVLQGEQTRIDAHGAAALVSSRGDIQIAAMDWEGSIQSIGPAEIQALGMDGASIQSQSTVKDAFYASRHSVAMSGRNTVNIGGRYIKTSSNTSTSLHGEDVRLGTSWGGVISPVGAGGRFHISHNWFNGRQLSSTDPIRALSLKSQNVNVDGSKGAHFSAESLRLEGSSNVRAS